MIDRILVVCVGNICRSPMAEGLMRARYSHRPTFAVTSAGLAALVDEPADPMARQLLLEQGVDISAHRARQVTPALLTENELVLVMEKVHEREVLGVWPGARGKVVRIGHFGGFDVPDPYLGSRSRFEEALRLIELGIEGFAAVIA